MGCHAGSARVGPAVLVGTKRALLGIKAQIVCSIKLQGLRVGFSDMASVEPILPRQPKFDRNRVCRVGHGDSVQKGDHAPEVKTRKGHDISCPYNGDTNRTRTNRLGQFLLAACSGTDSFSRGVMETTTYSRSLPSDSGTRRISLSLLMRNCAVSPMGSSAGCLSSFGRMR